MKKIVQVKDYYLSQLIEQPILRITNFNFPNLRCVKSYIGIFWCILVLIQNFYLVNIY